MKATLTIEVPDDFEKAECSKGERECPILEYCVANNIPYKDCPLEIQEGYKGCRNCKYQEAPLAACDYLKQLNHVELICQMYERKENNQ